MVLAKRELLRNAKFRFAGESSFFLMSSLRSGSVFAINKKCTDLDFSLLYILTSGTYSKFLWKNNFQRSAFAFRSPARGLAAGLPRQDHKSPSHVQT